LGPTNKQVGSPILHPADSDNPKQVGSFNRSAGSERIELKSIKSNQSAHIEAPTTVGTVGQQRIFPITLQIR